MSKAQPKTKESEEKEVVIYDADARNRFAYTVAQDGMNYETAHVFEPLSDERYQQWVREFNIKGNEDNVDEESREASVNLWNDLIYEVENVEEGVDIRKDIPFKEKNQAIDDLLAVAAFQPEGVATGKRQPRADATQVVLTEAYLNGHITQQRHVLKETSIEWEKKYARRQGKRFKQEITRGLRRKPKFEFVPQDEKIGEIYDDMFISVEGFAGRTPLRFKTEVIRHIYEAKMEAAEKK